MTSRPKQRIGITLGDPFGVGPQVTASALSKPSIRKLASYVLIGDADIYRRYAPLQYRNCSLVDVGIAQTKNSIGKRTAAGARSALKSLDMAVDMLKKGMLTGLVTAPVCKETLTRIDPAFQGHTEYLARAFHQKKVGMMFVADGMRSIIVTRHIPLNAVSRNLTIANISETIFLAHQALRKYFKLANPSIAVCGLNPHAGEEGTIGREEITKIIPAIKRAKAQRMNIHGPFAADTLFSPHTAKRYDAIVAMYHDQGLIPVKTVYFTKLVNLTIGLPFVRTSPAHGTAFDIAGTKAVNASSMCAAIRLAAQLSRPC